MWSGTNRKPMLTPISLCFLHVRKYLSLAKQARRLTPDGQRTSSHVHSNRTHKCAFREQYKFRSCLLTSVKSTFVKVDVPERQSASNDAFLDVLEQRCSSNQSSPYSRYPACLSLLFLAVLLVCRVCMSSNTSGGVRDTCSR